MCANSRNFMTKNRFLQQVPIFELMNWEWFEIIHAAEGKLPPNMYCVRQHFYMKLSFIFQFQLVPFALILFWRRSLWFHSYCVVWNQFQLVPFAWILFWRRSLRFHSYCVVWNLIGHLFLYFPLLLSWKRFYIFFISSWW